MSAAAEMAQAYGHCESVTRTQAANFFYGIRLLPGERRRAMSAVYAFARRVDDIGDGTLERSEKLTRLDEQARALEAIVGDGDGAGAGDVDPVLLALADARRRFALPVDALSELVEGVRMDVNGVRYESFEDLLGYCRRVAGGIGRLCLAIFGLRAQAHADPDQAERLADELGVALQLTNILRDLREDADNGRVYLPAEDLQRFGVLDHALAPDTVEDSPDAAQALSALARSLELRPRGGPVGEPRRGAAGRARPLRVRPRGAVVRPRDRAHAGARPAQRRVRAGHGRHLPAAARTHRRAPGGDAAPAHIAASAREGVGRGTSDAWSPWMSSGARVLVIGGGLAGITAALDCADAGASVTLLEVRRRLGGAAYSFERDGLLMDNGQHVFLRCCTAYRGLLARLGSEPLTSLQERLEIPVLSPRRQVALLRRGSLPAPAHLARALARYRFLTRRERLGAARAALALMRLELRDQSLDAVTFGTWLERHGQRPQALAALWDLVALPTLNLHAADASLALAAFVFRTGLLSSADAGDIGFHDAALGQTIDEPAQKALREAGVEVCLGWRAEQIVARADGFDVHGHGNADDGLGAEAVVLALPHTRAATLLEPLLGQPAHALAGLGISPIVNLHVVYDRPVCDWPFAAGVGTPVQYVFDRSRAAGAPPGCQYLAVSLSAAQQEMGMSVQQLRERYVPALRELFPRARQANVESFVATREHAATFRGAPGAGALRIGPQTAVRGLMLAGAWTATGWPATLESAVLSGHAAAVGAMRALEGARPPARTAGALAG